MSDSLLKTKWMPPATPAGLVPRPRLAARLGRALELPLTLVSAPPGAGKTTLLAAWLAERNIANGAHRPARRIAEHAPVRVAWLALDAHDDDPARFWRYVAAALGAATGCGAALAAGLRTPQPPPATALLAELINELADQPGPVLLVLDDYHHISQAEIHAGLEFLLEHAPANLHLLIATRADPPLPLHRLRARGQLLEIRAADLRFEPAEAAVLLNDVMALALTEAEVARLAERTEGWAAGLQLAGLALQGEPAQPDLIDRLARSSRYILDYLAEEVLHQQPVHVQSFLMQTAILERMCGGLCDAVTQQPGGQALLELLARRNLFVMPLGASASGDWFRYHQLFATVLRGHLFRRTPDQAAPLHRRAAAWYEAHDEIEAAIEHGLAGEAYEQVARLLGQHGGAMVMGGRALAVEGWLRRLPEPWRHSSPRASLAFAWALLLRGRYDELGPCLELAAAAIGPGDEPQLGELAALRAALANVRGEADAALALARRALAGIAPGNLLAQAFAHVALANALRARGDADAAIAAYEHCLPRCQAAGLIVPEMLARAHLGRLCLAQGRLRQAEAATRPALAGLGRHPAASAVHAALGEVLLERDQLAEAEAQLQPAIELARQSGHTAALVRAQTLLARLRRAQGDWPAAQALLDAAGQAAQAVPGWVAALLLAEQARLWLDQGALGPAEQLLIQAGAGAAAPAPEALPLVWAWLRFRQGRHAEALALVDSLAARGQVEALLLRALLHDAQGQAPAARADLRRALGLAEPEGSLRVFLEAGARLAAMLAEIGAAARWVLAARAPAPLAAAALPEPLSEREIAVLRLLARGLTYQQIAAELIVSVNTVRHHIKSLYAKLQVDSRALAVEQARTLGLL